MNLFFRVSEKRLNVDLQSPGNSEFSGFFIFYTPNLSLTASIPLNLIGKIFNFIYRSFPGGSYRSVKPPTHL